MLIPWSWDRERLSQPRSIIRICGRDSRSRCDWYLEFSLLLLTQSSVTLADEHYLDTLAGQLNPGLYCASAYAIFVCDQHALLPMAIRLSL